MCALMGSALCVSFCGFHFRVEMEGVYAVLHGDLV